eukprot:CAMPEP_0117476140 /NCGR_PEP_ID=MMETSP0784-20121206/10156_1 /TAXON_ID=39447 /ORGANISM="" /LENGTH=134 /DNA_ID=CAMNT_0005270407 /DNA_START=185 /DNA_END=585 /DNA_ORIENTATION=-
MPSTENRLVVEHNLKPAPRQCVASLDVRDRPVPRPRQAPGNRSPLAVGRRYPCGRLQCSEKPQAFAPRMQKTRGEVCLVDVVVLAALCHRQALAVRVEAPHPLPLCVVEQQEDHAQGLELERRCRAGPAKLDDG